MTMRELQERWQEYGFVVSEGKHRGTLVCLRDLFMVCWGEFDGGLLFDTGGAQGAKAFVLKVDDDDNLYARSGPGEGDWALLGKLQKI